MPVEVIVVFNPVGQIKPVYICREGIKSKITKVNFTMDFKDTKIFNCEVDGKTVVLCFDIMNKTWSID